MKAKLRPQALEDSSVEKIPGGSGRLRIPSPAKTFLVCGIPTVHKLIPIIPSKPSFKCHGPGRSFMSYLSTAGVTASPRLLDVLSPHPEKAQSLQHIPETSPVYVHLVLGVFRL